MLRRCQFDVGKTYTSSRIQRIVRARQARDITVSGNEIFYSNLYVGLAEKWPVAKWQEKHQAQYISGLVEKMVKIGSVALRHQKIFTKHQQAVALILLWQKEIRPTLSHCVSYTTIAPFIRKQFGSQGLNEIHRFSNRGHQMRDRENS